MKTKKQQNLIITNLISLIFSVSFFVLPLFAKAGEVTSDEIIGLVNQERQAAGLNTLVHNDLLEQAAQMKVKDMIGNNYFAHTSPSGIDPWHWFDVVGYDYKYAGENLAMDFSSAVSVHRAWMKSPTHRDNIMSDKFSEIGVAVMDGIINGRETKVAVQLFGTRTDRALALAAQKEKENQLDLSVDLLDVSFTPLNGNNSKEAIVFAQVTGKPQKVEAKIGQDFLPLEKIRDGVYLNLVSLEGIDWLNEDVLVRVNIDGRQTISKFIQKNTFLAQVNSNNKSVTEIKNASQKINNFSSIENQQVRRILEIIMDNNGIFITLAIVFLLTVANVWILEREEEKMIALISSGQTI